MAKTKENTIETLEQALEVIAQKDQKIAELEAVVANSKEELEAVVAEFEAELEAVKAETTEITKVVPGVYKSEAHGVTVRFKKGYVNMRYKAGIVPSAEIIKNKDGKFTEFLDNLIEIQSGTIEVVKKK